MIDFAGLVLSPCMATLAIAVTITPTVSQPHAAAYANRGIWTVQDVDVVLEDGSIIASKSYTLGIALADYAIAPLVGDGVAIGADNYLVDMVRPDGQGGVRLMLKALQP
jgi:hypothetical protein